MLKEHAAPSIYFLGADCVLGIVLGSIRNSDYSNQTWVHALMDLTVYWAWHGQCLIRESPKREGEAASPMESSTVLCQCLRSECSLSSWEGLERAREISLSKIPYLEKQNHYGQDYDFIS